MYFKFAVITVFFVSQTLAATKLVVQIDEYRRDAYNRMASDNAVPGYTVKLNKIFRNKPAERLASPKEKEEILKTVIATALIHDDKMKLFDSVDDVLPEFNDCAGTVRSHFQILWYAEYLARNYIRALVSEYDRLLMQKYAEGADDSALARAPDEARRAINARSIMDAANLTSGLRQLKSLSGIDENDFMQWVSDVYAAHGTGLYMDGRSWRMSSDYEPADLESYELEVNKRNPELKGVGISARLIPSINLAEARRGVTVDDSRKPLEAELVKMKSVDVAASAPTRSDADFNEILHREMRTLNDFEVDSEKKIRAANSLRLVIQKAPEEIAFKAAKFILADKFRVDSSHRDATVEYAASYMRTVVTSGSKVNALEASFLVLDYVYKSRKSLFLDKRLIQDIVFLLINALGDTSHPQRMRAANYLFCAAEPLSSLFSGYKEKILSRLVDIVTLGSSDEYEMAKLLYVYGDAAHKDLCMGTFRAIAKNPNHEKAFEVVDSIFKEKEPDFALECYLVLAGNVENTNAFEAVDIAIKILRGKGLFYDRCACLSLGEQYVKALKALCFIANKGDQRDAQNLMTTHSEGVFQDDRMTILRAKTIVECYKDSELVMQAAAFLLVGKKDDPLTGFPVKYVAIRRLEAMKNNPESPMNERAKSVLVRSAML